MIKARNFCLGYYGMYVGINDGNMEMVRRILEKIPRCFCCSNRGSIHFVFESISGGFCRCISVNFRVALCVGFPGGSDGKASACSAGDLGLIPEWGRSPGEGNGNPLQYSCLENSMI